MGLFAITPEQISLFTCLMFGISTSKPVLR